MLLRCYHDCFSILLRSCNDNIIISLWRYYDPIMICYDVIDVLLRAEPKQERIARK